MIRQAFVAGSFYPASRPTLRELVERLFEQSADAARGQRSTTVTRLRGILVPHAGLEYSGWVAAAGWRALADAASRPNASTDATVVILGTNHSAWLDGAGVWSDGAWRSPLGDVDVDPVVAGRVVGLGVPFAANSAAHLREHSIEVQLPLLQTAAPGLQIVPVAVAVGTGAAALAAGERLGHLIAELDQPGRRVLLAISTDLAHYPAHRDAERVTADLLPSILAVDPEDVAGIERAQRSADVPGLVCGMCGIEPTVLGLAALRAMGATTGIALAAATSADAGGPADRTVGYLAAAFS